MEGKIIEIKNILLAEDDAGHVELTLAALEENHLANTAVKQIGVFRAAVNEPPPYLGKEV
jgi:hypothetical protein